MQCRYDALLVLSFGGPEKPEDVMPFLENVTRGRNIPRQRLEKVAESYLMFGGRSPINDQCRKLIAAVESDLAGHGIDLPIYWGNRNWHPFIEDTMRRMRDDGVGRALVLATSAYASYSSCRQYLEDIDRARGEVGDGAPVCDKLGHLCSQPGFVDALEDRLREAFGRLPAEDRDAAHLLFTAHSLPMEMARSSRYVEQLEQVAADLAARIGQNDYRLVWQSRSGPPSQPWLEPDIKDALSDIAARGGPTRVVVQPIGFISDHMEVVYDLDAQAMDHARALRVEMVRAGTAGTHPRFIEAIRELIEERLERGNSADPCLARCCPNPWMVA
ncbi:MAG TPA: ferrochelatase [Bryobacteraceae bacterium]|nr:ferrochelatase [Bryobacteraceae bacterium]HPT26475.1 ferrochelatase [Bryobacteraceae bacterium]